MALGQWQATAKVSDLCMKGRETQFSRSPVKKQSFPEATINISSSHMSTFEPITDKKGKNTFSSC